jgi:hypothetical protein
MVDIVFVKQPAQPEEESHCEVSIRRGRGPLVVCRHEK